MQANEQIYLEQNNINSEYTIDEEEIEEILDIIDESHEMIFNIKEVVIFMGDIMGIITFLPDYLVPIHFRGSKMQNSIFPNLWKDTKHFRIYWRYDNDIHNVVQEITNAFCLYKLFYYSEKTKIVMITPYSSLENRAQSFFNLISNLLNLFNHISDFQDGLVIIVTKVGQYVTLKDIKEEIIPENIKILAEERNKARLDKDFNKSDEIREEIKGLGYEVKDKGDGFEIKKL